MQVSVTDRISIERRKEEFKKKRAKSSSSVESEKKQEFSRLVKEIIPNDDVDSIELVQLWEELPVVERELINRKSMKNLERYKSLVKKIVSATLKKALKLEQSVKRDPRTKKKKMLYNI